MFYWSHSYSYSTEALYSLSFVLLSVLIDTQLLDIKVSARPFVFFFAHHIINHISLLHHNVHYSLTCKHRSLVECLIIVI